MEISDLEFFVVEVPGNAPQPPVRSLLVRLATETGEEGWGEGQSPWRPWELEAQRRALLPVFTGRSVFAIEDLLQLEVLSTPQLRAAVEMAAWDLIGQVLRQPLCHLWGGMYRQRIPLAAHLPLCPPRQAAHLAKVWADQGFHAQLLTSSGSAEKDVRTLASVRQSTGDRVEFQLDAAAAYDHASARDLCAELEFDGLRALVDPLDGSDFHALAGLGRLTSVPLAVRRSIRGPADVLAAVRCGVAPLVILDLDRHGGTLPLRKSAAVAEAAGVQAILGGRPCLGIATAAMLHLAAANPALANANHSAYHQLQDDVLAEPLELLEGMVSVPHRPGLGVGVDRAKIEQWQVG